MLLNIALSDCIGASRMNALTCFNSTNLRGLLGQLHERIVASREQQRNFNTPPKFRLNTTGEVRHPLDLKTIHFQTAQPVGGQGMLLSNAEDDFR
jgi:hypothetical protein